MQLGRAGQQGPTRTLTAALETFNKTVTGTYSITQVKYYKQTTHTRLTALCPGLPGKPVPER